MNQVPNNANNFQGYFGHSNLTVASEFAIGKGGWFSPRHSSFL